MDGSVLLVVVLAGVAVWFFVRNRRLDQARSAWAAEKASLERRTEGAEREQRSTAERVATLNAQNETLARENAALARYRPIADVERVVQQTREQLAAEAAQAQQQIDDGRRRANEAGPQPHDPGRE